MSIVVRKRPYTYCFSGNPIHYELYSELAADNNSVEFEIRIMYRALGGNYQALPGIPYAPVLGTATIDISSILNAYLGYNLPSLSADPLQVQPASHSCMFYLQYREKTQLTPDPSWDDSEREFEIYCIKGGLSRFKYQGNNFWINYFFQERPFLTWQLNGRKASLEERMYLLFLSVGNYNNVQVFVNIAYTDNSQIIHTPTKFSSIPGQLLYIPAGAGQLGLTMVNAAKNIHWWELWVEDIDGNILSERFRYEADNRQDYNDKTLHYRSSLGSLDSLRVRGEIDRELAYEFSRQASVQMPDYFSGNAFAPQEKIYDNLEQEYWKGNTGPLTREEHDRLRDAQMQREVWWEVDGKWWPVNVVTSKVPLGRLSAMRWSLPIEWTLAHGGDPYYTPRTVNLGAAVFSDNVCQAFVSNVSVQIDLSGSEADITVDFDENDPQNASSEVRFCVPGYLEWTVVPYGTIHFSLPKGIEALLEIQSVCTNNIFGKKISTKLNTKTTQQPPPQDGNSLFVNNTSGVFGLYITLYPSTEIIHFEVGSFSQRKFQLTPANYTSIKVETDGFIPAVAYMTVDGEDVYPMSVQGNVFTFPFTFVTSGITITFK